jgi:hypothetical protein
MLNLSAEQLDALSHSLNCFEAVVCDNCHTFLKAWQVINDYGDGFNQNIFCTTCSDELAPILKTIKENREVEEETARQAWADRVLKTAAEKENKNAI